MILIVVDWRFSSSWSRKFVFEFGKMRLFGRELLGILGAMSVDSVVAGNGLRFERKSLMQKDVESLLVRERWRFDDSCCC